MRERQPSEILDQSARVQARCDCLPLSPRWNTALAAHTCMLIAPQLQQVLHNAITVCIPHSSPCSLLVLHITQFEGVSQTTEQSRQRTRYHAATSFLDQIVQHMRRSLRTGDQILVEKHGSGAALILPGVDQEGLACIARRVSQDIHLLQAETVVPPLRCETEIAFGWGTQFGSPDTLALLLEQAGQVRERIVFRPALTMLCAEGSGRTEYRSRPVQSKETPPREAHPAGIPFMQLPSRLPTRLQRLIPHALALELRCAPVGRDHNRLTVAMANPTDTRAISHLRNVTGMSIFPASCELVALETVLASGW